MAHRRAYGLDHPDTLKSLNDLAMTLRELGEDQRAHDLAGGALDHAERVFDFNDPVTTNLRLITQQPIKKK